MRAFRRRGHPRRGSVTAHSLTSAANSVQFLAAQVKPLTCIGCRCNLSLVTVSFVCEQLRNIERLKAFVHTHTRTHTHTPLPGLSSLLIVDANRSLGLGWSAFARTVACALSLHRLRFLPARRYANAGLCDSDVSVCPSVRPSVRPSVTRRYCA